MLAAMLEQFVSIEVFVIEQCLPRSADPQDNRFLAVQ